MWYIETYGESYTKWSKVGQNSQNWLKWPKKARTFSQFHMQIYQKSFPRKSVYAQGPLCDSVQFDFLSYLKTIRIAIFSLKNWKFGWVDYALSTQRENSINWWGGILRKHAKTCTTVADVLYTGKHVKTHTTVAAGVLHLETCKRTTPHWRVLWIVS